MIFFFRLIIIWFSDFKINVYVGLIGGVEFEFLGENFMFGFCGVLRDYFLCYCDGFVFECWVIK